MMLDDNDVDDDDDDDGDGNDDNDYEQWQNDYGLAVGLKVTKVLKVTGG